MPQPVANILSAAVALGVPALIALFVARRWRVRTILVWAAAPFVIVALVAASELISGKASPADIDKLVFGVLLISSFLLLPWLIACGAGYATGAFLRSKWRPNEATARHPLAIEPSNSAVPVAEAAPPAATAYNPPVDPDAPTLSAAGGWRAGHVGFERDGLMLDGLDVWSLTWRAEQADRVKLAHPAHPKEQHDFTVYNADNGDRAIRFAAAELSNGVWGFYRWEIPADLAAGFSADGTLRYEHDLGSIANGRPGSRTPIARLYEEASGAQLFDGAAWQSSRIVPQADGGLLLSLEQGERQALFRIDPAKGVFRDLATTSAPRPLADLVVAAADERSICDFPSQMYLSRSIAPDGSISVELEAAEWSNTHWVRSPRVTEIATGRVLLDLWGTDWDASVSYPRRQTVHLNFRRYHHGGGADVEIELQPERYVLQERGGGVTFGPLETLPTALEQASRRAVPDGLPAAPPSPAPLSPASRAGRRVVMVLAILLGASALIAVATLTTLRLQGEPATQTLDVIPPMPGQP